MYDIVFEGARIIDGSGAPAFTANLATLGGRIALIGKEKVRARTTVDASGMILAPGAIDIHAHSEFYALNNPAMEMRLAQGITSDISGNCGIGVFPVAGNRRRLEDLATDVLGRSRSWNWDGFSSFASVLGALPPAINMGFLQAHSPLRVAAMGDDTDREASAQEIEHMCRLLDESLSAGCFGFSTGLYYQPCTSASSGELEALASVAARRGRLMCVHMRSEGDDIVPSLEEVLNIALKTGVRLEVSHLKIIGRRNQDRLCRILELLHGFHDRGADVAFDAYPYNYGSTSLFSLLPPWALALSRTELRFALQLEDERRRMRHDMLSPDGWESLWSLVGPDRIRILHMDSRSDLDGKLLSELGDDPLEALFDTLADEGGTALMCDVTEDESTLETILSDPLMSFSTDALYSSAVVHPRSHSAALELVRHFCLERRLFTLEECIWRMSGENARRLGLSDRGLVREHAAADLVLFRPDSLDPSAGWQQSRGIEYVLVNGRTAFQSGHCNEGRNGGILLKV